MGMLERSTPNATGNNSAVDRQWRGRDALRRGLAGRGRDALRRGLAAAFESWGRLVTRHPYRVGLAALFICLSLCCGLLALAPENRSYFLWVPTTSRSYVEWQYIRDTFDAEAHGLVLYAEATEATDGNIFAYEALDELMKLHEFTLDLETTRGDGTIVRFKDACKRLDQVEECDTPSFLQLWGFSRQNLRRDRASILNAVSRLHAVSSVESFAANVRYEDDDKTRVESAQAVVLVYVLNAEDGAAYDIQPAWNKLIAGAADSKLLKVSHYSNRSFDDEVARLVLGDIPLFASGMVIITCFIAATLGSMRSLVRSRVLLGAFAIINVLLAVGAGFGVASASGVPFTAISALLPLIVLGVTVDSVIIFVDHLDAEDEREPLELRFGRALAKSGPAVLVTALTTIAALATSTNTVMPAVAMFASYGCLSFTASLCVVFSFFLSLLVLDERRLQAGRVSFAPCITPARVANSLAVTTVKALPQARPEASAAVPAPRAKPEAVAPGLSPVQRFLRDRYAPALLSPAGSAVVVLAFAALAILSALAVPRIQIGLPQSDVLPDDSYVRAALDAEKLFGGKISSAQIVVTGDNFDDADVRARYKRAHRNVARVDFVKLAPPYWLEAYERYLASRSLRDDEPFTSELRAFLDDERFTRFQEDVTCASAESCERPAAVRFRVVHSDGVGLAIDKLRLRDAMQTAITNAGIVAPIVFQEGYLLAESDAAIWYLTWTNMVYALAAIFGIVLLFNETLPAVWITVCVALIDLDLLGVIWMVGLKLNAVTYVNLVMAVGLSVDYCVHIAHAFVEAHAHAVAEAAEGVRVHPKDAATAALTTMGSSVLKGGFTTILGVLVIAFASSVAFRTFFTMISFTVLLGLMHGVILMPVLLTYATVLPHASPKP